MIKKLGLLSVLLFMGLTMSAQETVSTEKKACNKPCTPTKECAAKYGMTLEECKKICASKNAGAQASTENVQSSETEEGAETKVASYEVSKENVVASKKSDAKICDKKKKCCKSKKEKV